MTSKARIDLRLPQELKELLESAAARLGQSLTDFALTTMRERALEVQAQGERTLLSNRDRARFLSILDEEQPSATLRRAAAKVKKRGKRGRKGVDGRASRKSSR